MQLCLGKSGQKQNGENVKFLSNKVTFKYFEIKFRIILWCGSQAPKYSYYNSNFVTCYLPNFIPTHLRVHLTRHFK